MWQLIGALFGLLTLEKEVRRPRRSVKLELSGYEDRIVPAVLNTPAIPLGLTYTVSENVTAAQPIDRINVTIGGSVQFTALLTGFTANVNCYLRDAQTNAIIASGTNSGTASESIGMTIHSPFATTRGLRMEVVSVNGSSSAYTLTMNAAAGWSQTTGFRDANTPVRVAVAAAGKNAIVGAPSGRSIFDDSRWHTDATDFANGGNDGTRMINALNILKNWRVMNPTATFIPQITIDTMMPQLMSGGGYNQQDAGLIKNRMHSQFVANSMSLAIPSTKQGVMDLLGTDAQCKEYAFTIVMGAGGANKPYGAPGVASPTDFRAGMVCFFYPTASRVANQATHTALVYDVKWDAAGTPIALRIAESNVGDGSQQFSRPQLQVPWSRTITKREVALTLTSQGPKIGTQFVSIVNCG